MLVMRCFAYKKKLDEKQFLNIDRIRDEWRRCDDLACKITAQIIPTLVSLF